MRVAVVGGLARQAADCVWKYPGIDVTHYNAEEVRRVVASANRGGAEVVILVTKFISHQTEAAVRNTGVKMVRWDQGLKELSRKLPSIVGPLNAANVNGHGSNVPTKADVAQLERSWVDRVVDVLKLDWNKLWTTRDIMEELGLGVGKQPRVSEALVKLRSRGMAKAAWIGREKGHRYVPEAEQPAALAEYEAEVAAQVAEPVETQQEALEATGHVLPASTFSAPPAPPAVPAVALAAPPEDHAADLGTIFARARVAKKRAAARVASLEADLKIARAALAKAESDEAGALSMLDEMAGE